MTKRNVTHSTFVLERVYPSTPARVFNAFADPKAKARWFGAPADSGWVQKEAVMEFRVGGREISVGEMKDGLKVAFRVLYQDIVPNERIVYTYDMEMNDRRISVSLATLEFTPDGKGTRLKLTEQGAYLDGLDNAPQRQKGTEDLLDKLGKYLAGATA